MVLRYTKTRPICHASQIMLHALAKNAWTRVLRVVVLYWPLCVDDGLSWLVKNAV